MRDVIERIIALPTRKVVLILVAVICTCGPLTALLIRDAQLQGASPEFNEWEIYSEDWRIPLKQKVQLDVIGDAIDVQITFHNGSDIIAQFNGQRPTEEYAVQASVADDRISIRDRGHSERTNGLEWMDVSQRLTGLLELSLPNALIGAVEVTLSSGYIDISDAKTDSLKLVSSSGSIALRDGVCQGDIDISSFSGDVSVDNLRAEHGKFSSSSGSITAENLRLLSLHSDQFSAWGRYINVDIEQDMTFSTSSGELFIDGFTGENVSVNGFSGALNLRNGVLRQSLTVDSSSGCLDITQLGAEKVMTKTFSGYQRIEELNALSLTAESSSGDITAHLLGNANIDCTTFSGDVWLSLPEAASFSLELDTFSGASDIAFPLKISSGNGNRTISGTVGNGESTVKVSTSSGDITIQPH